MSWNSWSEFWAMGGYGLYVWGSMGMVIAVIAGEVLGLVWQRKGVVAAVRQARRQHLAGRQAQAPRVPSNAKGAP